MKKRFLALCLVFMMAFSFTACGEEEVPDKSVSSNVGQTDTKSPANTATKAPTQAPVSEGNSSEDESSNVGDSDVEAEKSEWAVYWYLCGSDLESGGAFATMDLAEMLEVSLPDNVNVVIETGGSSVWHNDIVDASKLQRWVYNSEGMFLADEQPSANMGDARTLADFLSFAKTNFPAEKTAVVFWNHGGGSVTGAAFDELYGFDSLTLDEMYMAFSSVFETSEENQPLELIGFDTCLMATVDVACTFYDIAKYMVASEETEPANGWYCKTSE